MIFQGKVLGYGDIASFDVIAITQARVVDDILFVRSDLGETPVEILTITTTEKTTGTCKACKHFNWKLSTSKEWGECLNPTVLDAIRISWRHVWGLHSHPELLKEIDDYARVQFVEGEFGCIYFEVNK